FHSPTVADGLSGFAVLTFTVHGSMSTDIGQSSTAHTNLTVKHGTTTYESDNLQVFNGSSTVNNPPPPAGMTVTASGMSGSVSFNTLQIPVVFGTGEQLRAGLLTETNRSA